MELPSDPSRGTSTVPHTNGTTLTDKNGWDGKLRVGKKAEVLDPESPSDPENSDEDAHPGEQIEPDEGRIWSSWSLYKC